MKPIRFAIWSAVSSKAQAAEDKISIPEQIKLCRKDGLSRGWQETAGPFIVPGESRTRWINLRDAENSIQNKQDNSFPLREMLDAASRKEFDVLILYHYNRFRDLLDAVDKTLQAYGIQMTSHSQWTDPQPPETYDPLSDVGRTIRFATAFTSSAEIIEIRRRHKLGMPSRVQRGLPPGLIHFGYRKPINRQIPPTIDPTTATVVIKIKDLFLAGQSLWQIADHLTAQNIQSYTGKTKWTDVMVYNILKNRFYCGDVTYGKTRRIIDPRNGDVKIIKNLPSRITTAAGLHDPLWDMHTQSQIDNEWSRRSRSYSGKRTNRLSQILYCGICGARCHVAYPGGYAEESRRWACSANYQHVNRKDTELIQAFITQLIQTIQTAETPPLPQPTQNTTLPNNNAIELTQRRRRITDAYEAGAMTLTEYTERTNKLDKLIEENNKQITELQTSHTRQNQRLKIIGGFRGILQKIPAYITEAPPQEVNHQLRAFIQRVTITPNTLHIELIP